MGKKPSKDKRPRQVHKNLAYLRQHYLNISANKFAALFHFHLSSVYKYEEGSQTPSFDLVKRIADYFNLTMDEMLSKDISAKLTNTYYRALPKEVASPQYRQPFKDHFLLVVKALVASGQAGSPEVFTEAVGMSSEALENKLSGINDLTVSHIYKLKMVYPSVNLDYIFTGSGSPLLPRQEGWAVSEAQMLEAIQQKVELISKTVELIDLRMKKD